MNKIRNIIITGADGFVGSNTATYFLNKGIHVLAIGRKPDLSRIEKQENLEYLCADLSKPEKLLELIPDKKYDAFIHFAWDGSAGSKRMDYVLQMNNAYNTVECMKIAKKIGCTRFVGAGSIMEKEVLVAIAEQGSRPGMGYIYGMGKQLAHSICKAVAADIGIDLLWPMITNAYGIGEFSPRFINTTIRKIITKESLHFTAATQNYDFVYVTDVAKAYYLITLYGKPFYEYIIGSGAAKPLKEFIYEMTSALSADTAPVFGDIPFTGTNIPLETFSISTLTEDTGFAPDITFSEGVIKTMKWLKKCEVNIYDTAVRV